MVKTHVVCKRNGKKWKEEFEKLVSDRDCLFDIFCEDKQERQLMEIEYGIIMEKDDFEFLNAMRTNRKLASCKGVDSSWYKKKLIEEKLSKKKVCENATFLVSTIDDDADDDEVEELDDMIMIQMNLITMIKLMRRLPHQNAENRLMTFQKSIGHHQ